MLKMNKEKVYKVFNKAKDTRKFRDKDLGIDIFIRPKKFILTKRPPKGNDIWKVEIFEELEEKRQKIKSNRRLKK